MVQNDDALFDSELEPTPLICEPPSTLPSTRLGDLIPRSSSSRTPSVSPLRRRSSAFVEVGLSGDDPIVDAVLKRIESGHRLSGSLPTATEIQEEKEEAAVTDTSRTSLNQHTTLPSSSFPSMSRLLIFALLLAIVLPSLSSPFGKSATSPIGAKAGPIQRTPIYDPQTLPAELVRRDDSPTDICTRWSQQTAIVNNTLYIYGGRATTSAGQTSNEWNNDFLTLDLSKTWQISSPTLEGLAQPSGPPPVANGYLWHSQDTLFLYGGEFSDTPATSPVPYSTWSYNIPSSSWSEAQNPQTSSGDDSDGGSQPVQRAAEGAGITVPSLGRGYYFGGHLDGYTTAGWSQSIARVYLTSLLEFTFPGYSNPSIDNSQAAGSDGLYRNITQGGLQSTASFPERADGVLVYIPGFGKEGIILGLAGGTNATFTQMNVIDVYDIANSTWYKQSTSGSTPNIRVNPCTVAQSAADGSSIQVYMFGGQNLIPYGQQTQYSDMWILTIPSFTWIQVDTDNQAVPMGRAGHTCDAWNAQMIVVGGYVGTQYSCDTPGIYVFNLSSLEWQNQYTALDGGNYLNQQKSQTKDTSGLSGSYGYEVPVVVQKVIGGNALGGATVTAPALSATAGPFATGSPIVYTITQSSGVVVTATSTSTSSPNTGGTDPSSTSGSNGGGGGGGGSNVGAIVAGVLAGILAVLAAYLGFCTWIYRRQLKLYKNHVSMAQRSHLDPTSGVIGAGIPVPGGKQSARKFSFEESHSGMSGDASGSGGSTSGRGSGRGPGRPAAYQPLGTNNPYASYVRPAGNLSTTNSSTEDLMAGHEPTFLGVFLNPRRSLRVVNRD